MNRSPIKVSQKMFSVIREDGTLLLSQVANLGSTKSYFESMALTVLLRYLKTLLMWNLLGVPCASTQICCPVTKLNKKVILIGEINDAMRKHFAPNASNKRVVLLVTPIDLGLLQGCRLLEICYHWERSLMSRCSNGEKNMEIHLDSQLDQNYLSWSINTKQSRKLSWMKQQPDVTSWTTAYHIYRGTLMVGHVQKFFLPGKAPVLKWWYRSVLPDYGAAVVVDLKSAIWLHLLVVIRESSLFDHCLHCVCFLYNGQSFLAHLLNDASNNHLSSAQRSHFVAHDLEALRSFNLAPWEKLQQPRLLKSMVTELLRPI